MLALNMTQMLAIVEPIFEDNVYFIGYIYAIYKSYCAQTFSF